MIAQVEGTRTTLRRKLCSLRKLLSIFLRTSHFFLEKHIKITYSVVFQGLIPGNIQILILLLAFLENYENQDKDHPYFHSIPPQHLLNPRRYLPCLSASG